MMFINVLRVILFAIILPILIGRNFFVNKDIKIYKSFIYGTFLIWAFIELIGVVLILLKSSFNLVFILICLFVLIACILGIDKIIKDKKIFVFKKLNNKEIIFLSLLFIILIIFMYLSFAYQHVDEDDSRFIVNAVDMLKTNKMLLTNPATGEMLQGFVLWEVEKDIVSPFAIYLATMSRLTGLSVVVFAHSFLPLILILLAVSIWWYIAERLIGEKTIEQCMFVILVMLIHLFGYSHLWSQITMFMERLWQGKAIVSSIGIPCMFAALIDYYDNDDFRHFMMILTIDLGMSLLSGMGIVIGAIIIACFALAYSILKKDIKVMFYLLSICLINFIYYLLEINI